MDSSSVLVKCVCIFIPNIVLVADCMLSNVNTQC